MNSFHTNDFEFPTTVEELEAALEEFGITPEQLVLAMGPLSELENFLKSFELQKTCRANLQQLKSNTKAELRRMRKRGVFLPPQTLH